MNSKELSSIVFQKMSQKIYFLVTTDELGLDDQMTIDACNDAILKFLINADIIQQASFIASEEE